MRKKASITTENMVKIIIALLFLITGIMIAVLLRTRSTDVIKEVQNVLSFGFLR